MKERNPRWFSRALIYIVSLDWVDAAGRWIVRFFSAGKIRLTRIDSEEVVANFEHAATTPKKAWVVVKAICSFIIAFEIGFWFWFVALCFGLFVFAVLFGPIPSVHEW